MNQRNASLQQPQCLPTNAASTSAMIHSQGPMVGNVPANAPVFYTPIQSDGYPQMFQYGFPYGEGVYPQADLYATQGGIPQQMSTYNLPRGSMPTNGQNEYVQMNGFVATQGPSSADAAMGNYVQVQNRRIDPRNRFSSMFDNGADSYTASWVSSTSSIPPDLKVPPDSSGPNTPSGMEYPNWGGGDMPAMMSHQNIRRESSVDEFAAGASATSGFSPPSDMNLEGVMANLNLGNQVHPGRNQMQNFPISSNSAAPAARRVQRDETWADIARRGVDRSETNNPLPISVAPPHMISPASQMRQNNQIQGGQAPPANQPLMRNMASMPYRQGAHDPRRNNAPNENSHDADVRDSGSSRSAYGLNSAGNNVRYDRGQQQLRGGNRRIGNQPRNTTENRGQPQRRPGNHEQGRRFQRPDGFHQGRPGQSGGIQYSPDAPADPSSGHHNKSEASPRTNNHQVQSAATHAFTSGCQGTSLSHSQPQPLFIPPNNSFVPPLLQSQMPFGIHQQFVTLPNPMTMNNFVSPMVQPQSGQQSGSDQGNQQSQQPQQLAFNSPHALPMPAFMPRTFTHGQGFPVQAQPPFMPFPIMHNEMFAHGIPPPFFNAGVPMVEPLPNPLFPRDHQTISPQRDRFRDTWLDQANRPPEQSVVEMQLIPRAAMHNNAIDYARDKGIPLNAFAGSLLHTTRTAANRNEHPERSNRNRTNRGRGGFRATGQKNDTFKGKE